MSKKVYANAQEALVGIEDNMTLMLGGFGLCGIPCQSQHLVKRKVVLNMNGRERFSHCIFCLWTPYQLPWLRTVLREVIAKLYRVVIRRALLP